MNKEEYLKSIKQQFTEHSKDKTLIINNIYKDIYNKKCGWENLCTFRVSQNSNFNIEIKTKSYMYDVSRNKIRNIFLIGYKTFNKTLEETFYFKREYSHSDNLLVENLICGLEELALTEINLKRKAILNMIKTDGANLKQENIITESTNAIKTQNQIIDYCFERKINVENLIIICDWKYLKEIIEPLKLTLLDLSNSSYDWRFAELKQLCAYISLEKIVYIPLAKEIVLYNKVESYQDIRLFDNDVLFYAIDKSTGPDFLKAWEFRQQPLKVEREVESDKITLGAAAEYIVKLGDQYKAFYF